MVAGASRAFAARARRAGRDFAAPFELSRARARVAEPRDGRPAGRGARHSAAGSTMRCCWRRASPPSGANATLPHRTSLKWRARSTTCWRNRSRTQPSWSTATGTCSRAMRGAVRLVEFLVGPIAPGTPINLADALVAPDVLRPYLTNWAEVVRHFIRSVEADAAADGLDRDDGSARKADGLQGRSVGTEPCPEQGRQRPGPGDAFSQARHVACACLPPLPRSARRRTSRCRSCASSASFRWMMRPQSFCEAGPMRHDVNCKSSLRGAKRRSNPDDGAEEFGLLRFARNHGAVRPKFAES